MAHDQRHTPPTRDDDPSPHQEDIRSRHELDEDRHRRDHYNHHDERRERPPADEHHRPAPNDREETDRREDHHHREDLDNRRFRHDDHHNDYPGENHHHGDRGGADRRENPDRHEEARHHPQDDRPTDARPDDRDHRPDDRHLRPAGGNGAPDDRENHNHPHPHHQSPPDRSDAPDAVGNGNANVPPRHDVRPHSPPPHPQQHDPNAPEDAGAPSSSDIPIDDSLVNLFVRNVAKHVQETQLIDLFNKYGKVDSAVVVRDPHSRECRGFGFVKMTTEKEAQLAVDSLVNFEFEGRQISVERAKRNGPHTRTPGAYMGLDRRIRDRYAGIKRSREYAYAYVGGPYPPPPPAHYPPYRPPRYHDGPGGPRPRHDYRAMHPPPPPPDYHRGPPPMNPRGGYEPRAPTDERDRQRRRYESDAGGARYSPRGAEPPRDQRVDGREPPVPRESADDMI